jgi:hypothetical protein
MVWFEVFLPAKTAGQPNVTLTVEAQNWIGALRTGLSNLGEGHDAIANVMCDIKEDNSIHVTDVSTQRVFRLREVPAPTAKPAASAASSAPPPEATRPTPHAPGPPRPVSMPEIPRDLLDDPLPGDATIPNPVAVGDIDSSVPWTKMAAPNLPVSATVELKAAMPPPTALSSSKAAVPKSTQMMFRADVKPPDVTLPDSPPPQPPAPAQNPVPAKAEAKPEPLAVGAVALRDGRVRRGPLEHALVAAEQGSKALVHDEHGHASRSAPRLLIAAIATPAAAAAAIATAAVVRHSGQPPGAPALS